MNSGNLNWDKVLGEFHGGAEGSLVFRARKTSAVKETAEIGGRGNRKSVGGQNRLVVLFFGGFL